MFEKLLERIRNFFIGGEAPVTPPPIANAQPQPHAVKLNALADEHRSKLVEAAPWQPGYEGAVIKTEEAKPVTVAAPKSQPAKKPAAKRATKQPSKAAAPSKPVAKKTPAAKKPASKSSKKPSAK